MKKVFRNSLLFSFNPDSFPKVLKKYYFSKNENDVIKFYYLEILGLNDAVGTYDSGAMDCYEFEHAAYFGEYRDRVDEAAYEDAIANGFCEINETEFMQLVDEKYPGWRNEK